MFFITSSSFESFALNQLHDAFSKSILLFSSLLPEIAPKHLILYQVSTFLVSILIPLSTDTYGILKTSGHVSDLTVLKLRLNIQISQN